MEGTLICLCCPNCNARGYSDRLVAVRDFLTFLPGIGVLILIGGIARLLSTVIGINHLIVAIALGIVLTNLVGVPGWAKPGVDTQKLWLETGIVLMGSQLSLGVISRAGPRLLAMVIGVITFTGLFTELLSRRLFSIEEKLGSLLAAGSSICGVSAIIAVSRSIRSNEDQIAYAVATILLFDATTVFAYPLIGTILDLSAQVYGIWAGLSMFSTGPAVAAGFAQSEVAGQWATVTKLARNLFIALVAIGYSVLYAQNRGSDSVASIGQIWSEFPKFLIGFGIFMLLANEGVFSTSQLTSLNNAYNWLFLFSFAGLGLTITVEDLRTAGTRPVLLVVLVFLTISALSLVSTIAVFGVA